MTFRLPERLLDELDAERKACGYRTMSQYLRHVIEKRNMHGSPVTDTCLGTATAINRLSKEIKKVGRNYNQFVRAYNSSVACTGEKPLPEKWTQRNLIGLMELTVEMIRNIHSLLDHFGIQHGDVRTSSDPQGTGMEERQKDLPQRRVTVPKY